MAYISSTANISASLINRQWPLPCYVSILLAKWISMVLIFNWISRKRFLCKGQRRLLSTPSTIKGVCNNLQICCKSDQLFLTREYDRAERRLIWINIAMKSRGLVCNRTGYLICISGSSRTALPSVPLHAVLKKGGFWLNPKPISPCGSFRTRRPFHSHGLT